MKIEAAPRVQATTAPKPAAAAAPKQPSVSHGSGPWTNPAAAAAMRSSVDLLKGIEDGILKHLDNIDRVRSFAIDLRSTSEIFTTASDAIANDGFKENDQFLPLINRASGSVSGAEGRLLSKDLAATWPSARADVISAIRSSRVISDNVARQLDPTARA